MKRYLLSLLVLLTILGGLTFTTTKVAHAATNSCITPSGTNVLQGNIDGANYIISVPSNWNGTLVLYSHGYVFPNQPLLNPAPGARHSIAPLPSMSSWRGMHCQSSILKIPQVPSV